MKAVPANATECSCTVANTSTLPNAFRRSLRFYVFAFFRQQKLVENDGGGANADETIGQVEDGKGPCIGMKQDVVDHMPIEKEVDQIAQRSGDDQGKAEMGQPTVLCRPAPQPDHESNDDK